MKRFGIVGMGLLGMLAHSGYFEEAGDGGEGAAAVDTPAAPASTKVEGADAPAAPAKPETGKTDDVLDKAGYALAENDPGLNYAMTFLATNGFNADNPAVEAAFDGDFSLLKAELAAKGIGGWEQAVGLAEQSYGRHVDAAKATEAKVGEVVTGVAEKAGVDWEQAIAHVGKTASADERTAINQLLSNPATAHIAAQFITGSFIDSGDVEYNPAARAVSDGAQAHQGAQGGALTRAEYTTEMNKLRKTIGEDYMDSPQAQALYRRLSR